MFAVIEDSGTQIRVREGDVIKVDPRDLPEDALQMTFDRVMYVGSEEDEASTQIGQPFVEGATVTADILEEGRDPKIDVVKFKRRKGYKRRRGHRQPFLKVKVTGIQAG